MTVIDRISFRFGMADEQFARGLYADWDGFCRRCVTDILEEFFDRYDTKDTYIEIDRLDLELGGIPQEEFYEVFPVRLREALEHSFIRQLGETGIARPEGAENTDEGAAPVPDKSSPYAREKRFVNLLHYLEYGFCLPEWDVREFDLYAELMQFRDAAYTERLLPLLASKPYVLERLFLQTDAERLEEAIPFTAWLSSSALGRHEKQRYLSAVLEHSPQALIRFIHGAEDAGSVEGMAELLENPHIRHIMVAETENHAEIDVPEYWYRLYSWLLEYYPFNGVPMFGDKRHFRMHLNRRLLTFIRKRDYQAYLSKADLTIQFLLEVFGADYYMTVLDIIYRNQPLKEDGSPATGDGYAWELYYMLLQLSLLGTGENAEENAERQSAKEGQSASSPHTDVSALLAGHTGSFERWLENPEQPDHVKRESLLRLAKERPELLIRWLKTRPKRKYLSLSAGLIDGPTLLLFAGSVSLQLAETVSVMSDVLDKPSVSVSWLQNIGKDRLLMALKSAVWQGIAMGIFPASDSAMVRLLQIAGLLYQEITGLEVASAVRTSSAIGEAVSADKSGLADNPAVPEPLRGLMEYIAADFPSLNIIEESTEDRYNRHRPDRHIPATERLASLKAVLSDNRMPDMAKRLLILQWFDACQGGEREFVWSLQEEKLLDAVISLLDTAVLRHIVVRLAIQGYGTGEESGTAIASFVRLLAEHIEEIAATVSRPPKTVWRALFVSLASWTSSITSGLGNGYIDSAIRLISDIAGNDKVQTVIESLIGKLLHIPYIAPSRNETIYRDSDAAGSLPNFENNALLSLLVRLQQYIAAQKQASGWFVTDAGKDDRTGTETDIHKDSADKNPDVLTDRKALNEARTAFEHCLNDTTGMVGWLHNGSFSVAQKRAIFLRYMAELPDKAIRLIQETIGSDESSAALCSEIIGKDKVLHLIELTDSALSDVLVQTIGIAIAALAGTGLFAGGSAERDISITRAILLLLAERPEADNMDVKEIVSLFLRSLYYVLTGNKEYTAADRERWQMTEKEALNILARSSAAADTDFGTASDDSDGNGMKLSSPDDRKPEYGGKIFDKWTAWLLSPSVSDTEKSQMLRYYARWQPKLLWEFVRYSTVESPNKSNIPFFRWDTWMDTYTWLEMIAGVSFSLAETLRRTAETLSGKYGITESVLSEGLTRLVVGYPADRIHYGNASSVIKDYIEILVISIWKGEVPNTVLEQFKAIADSNQPEYKESETTLRTEKLLAVRESIVRDVEAELHVSDAEQALAEAVQPDYLEVSNAGLCLLAIWLPRLFDMLGLLAVNADGKKDFKDIEARIRAIFILQRLVTDEVREYEEHELAFNRILTGCPFHVPLPKTLELTQNEIQTAESMLAGVKANWDKLKNTSIKGFQRSFMERPGRLEKREDKWVLYVENRGYDILLDSLPWSYRSIRLPWLKKKINVVWRDKEEFDFWSN